MVENARQKTVFAIQIEKSQWAGHIATYISVLTTTYNQSFLNVRQVYHQCLGYAGNDISIGTVSHPPSTSFVHFFVTIPYRY
jgi:hypothetical protein